MTMRLHLLQRHVSTLCLIGLALVCFNPCPIATAAPLDLDLTFDSDGKRLTGFQLDPSFPSDSGSAVAVQPDGKIVVAGTAYNGSQKMNDFALVRYTQSGSIDTSFGSSGRVTTDFGSTDDAAVGVAVQPDGKIVVAGTVGVPGQFNSYDIGLARYDSNGVLDPTFGPSGNGRVRSDFAKFEVAHGVALQQDGKIVVVGQREPSGNDSDFLVVRYMADGTLDAGFGSGGWVVTDFGMWDIAWAVAIQQDGRIVVAGSTWGEGFQPSRGALARYNSDGTLDASLNKGVLCWPSPCGKISTDLGGGPYDWPTSVALRKADGTEDGKIVVAGQFGVARFNANGSFDTTFGGTGVTNTPLNTGAGVAIRTDGRIVTAGIDGTDFGVAIYKANGAVDTACSYGSVTTDFMGQPDAANAITIQSDGKLVVAGWGHKAADDIDFAVARYKGGPCYQRAGPHIGHPFFLAYNIFVHPQYPPNGPAPIAQKELYSRLKMGRAGRQPERLVIPASSGGSLPSPVTTGFETFTVTEKEEGKRHSEETRLRVANAFGESLIEVVESDLLMVPVRFPASQSRASPDAQDAGYPLKCYRAKGRSVAPVRREKQELTLTDALQRTQIISVGEPAYWCKSIDRTGVELPSQAEGLVGYGISLERTTETPARSTYLHTASEFGTRLLQLEQPDLLFLPSVAQ